MFALRLAIACRPSRLARPRGVARDLVQALVPPPPPPPLIAAISFAEHRLGEPPTRGPLRKPCGDMPLIPARCTARVNHFPNPRAVEAPAPIR